MPPEPASTNHAEAEKFAKFWLDRPLLPPGVEKLHEQVLVATAYLETITQRDRLIGIAQDLRAAVTQYAEWHGPSCSCHPDDCPDPKTCRGCAIDGALDRALLPVPLYKVGSLDRAATASSEDRADESDARSKAAEILEAPHHAFTRLGNLARWALELDDRVAVLETEQSHRSEQLQENDEVLAAQAKRLEYLRRAATEFAEWHGHCPAHPKHPRFNCRGCDIDRELDRALAVCGVEDVGRIDGPDGTSWSRGSEPRGRKADMPDPNNRDEHEGRTIAQKWSDEAYWQDPPRTHPTAEFTLARWALDLAEHVQLLETQRDNLYDRLEKRTQESADFAELEERLEALGSERDRLLERLQASEASKAGLQESSTAGRALKRVRELRDSFRSGPRHEAVRRACLILEDEIADERYRAEQRAASESREPPAVKTVIKDQLVLALVETLERERNEARALAARWRRGAIWPGYGTWRFPWEESE